jgi:ArsR family transcriptional regulator
VVGAIHGAEETRRLLDGEMDLEVTLHSLPARKREWLEHVDLYPPSPLSGMFRALDTVIRDPAGALRRLAGTLERYHREIFADTWTELAPRFAESLAVKRRLFDATSLEEFFRLALLRVEVDTAHRLFRAIRGGYELPFDRLTTAYVLPSVFNTGRYWTGHQEDGGEVVFLPYFDPDIEVGPPGGAGAAAADPAIDVALVAKALGDPTRFAIASLIARRPMSSAQIADALKVTRPTVSHHVVLLREASLLDEESRGGSIYLSLRRETLAALSTAALRRFFGA